MDKLRRDGSLAQGSARQRLFGFQMLGWNRYLVPESCSVYKKLANQAGSSKKSTDGYRCGSDELGRSITHFISNRTLDRTKTQDDICRGVHGFSPCLQLLVQKECSPLEEIGPCTFQHVQPEELTPNWYHARVRLILLQFRILDLARHDGLDVKKYVLVYSRKCAWILIKSEVTGLGCCTQRFIHLLRGSDHWRILRLATCPVERGLCENGLNTSVAIQSITTSRNPRTASSIGSWSHARWPSTLIERTPGNLFLIRGCARKRCGHNPYSELVRRRIRLHNRIPSRL